MGKKEILNNDILEENTSIDELYMKSIELIDYARRIAVK